MRVCTVVLKRVLKDCSGALLEFQFENGLVEEKPFRFDSEDLKNYRFADVLCKPVHVRVYRTSEGSIRIDTKHFIESNSLKAFVSFDCFLGVF